MQYFFFFLFSFFYLAFTASIFVEHQILWYFIYFQKTTPFEMLDVKKSEYQKTELRVMKGVKYWILLIGAIPLVFFLLIVSYTLILEEQNA